MIFSFSARGSWGHPTNPNHQVMTAKERDRETESGQQLAVVSPALEVRSDWVVPEGSDSSQTLSGNEYD